MAAALCFSTARVTFSRRCAVPWSASRSQPATRAKNQFDLTRATTMPPPLPVPTLDHVVVNVRDRIDEAAETYCRLGFTLTPRGYHTLGSINHLAMFGTDYLELIGVPEGASSGRLGLLDFPAG